MSVLARWIGHLGLVAAGLIATGVVIPLGLEVAGIRNFIGYVAWRIWLVAMAAVLQLTATLAVARLGRTR